MVGIFADRVSFAFLMSWAMLSSSAQSHANKQRAAAGICLHGFGRQLWCATIFRRESYFELRIFAPPFGPPDLARCTSGLNNNPLFGGTEGWGRRPMRPRRATVQAPSVRSRGKD